LQVRGAGKSFFPFGRLNEVGVWCLLFD
jgi:hypothetical protein